MCTSRLSVVTSLILCSLTISPALAAPDTWDSRLNNVCGLFLDDIASSLADGTGYWRLSIGLFEDESQAGGTHHVYYKCLDINGNPIENQKTWTSWNYTNETNFIWQLTKGPLDGYWGNFGMSANCGPGGCDWPYNAYIDSAPGPQGHAGPSDKVWGMGMTNPGITPCGAHVSFRLTWKWTIKNGGGGSTPTIQLTPTTLTPSTTIGSSPANQTFTVRNSGTGTLIYSISDNVSWLSVSPTSGTSTGENDTITVTYSTASLGVGTYNGTITVTDPAATNNPQTVAVTLTVNSSGGSNLLANPNFEGGFYNNPDIDHQSGNFWNRFSVSGTSKAGGVFGTYHSANWSQSIYEANWVAGVYQQVTASLTRIYQGSVWVRGADANVRFWVGVDPAGGTNPAAASIVWSAQTNPGTTWTQITAQATSTATTVTIFLKAQNPQGINLPAYLDDASLIDAGPGSSTPTITRSPATLSPSVTQGGNAANQTFTVQNTGGGTLNYSISDDVTWLSVSPTSGTSTTEVDTMTVSYTTSSLGVGTHNGTITISDPAATNNPQTIAVTLTVIAPPTITRSPATLSPSVTQGGNAANQTFTVQNTGGGTLSYSITDNVTWLAVSPTSGTSTGEVDTMTVSYTTSSLTAGSYNGTITITDPAATNNPQTIAVTLTVNPPPPTITRSPATLSPSVQQGGNAANQTFTVQNTGGQTLNYSITDNVTWLSVSPASGTSTGEVDTMTVSYTTSGLGVGTHNATITISDPAATNNPQTIAVTLTVTALPAITRSPATLAPSCTQGTNAANQTFTVQNTGGGTLSYSISDNVTWLAVSPTSGTSTGEVDTMTVSYTTSALTPGTYNGTITISDPNASNNPQTIAVTLTVTSVLTVAEDFNTVPTWTSEFNAAWGGAATWSSVTGGQAGNHLQATRSNNGSSSKVMVYNITANTNYTISIYMKGASSTSTYWVECAYKMGSNTAQNFDASGGTWTMIKKFENVSGSNGNGDVWTIYTKTFNSGASTQVSVGFKLGLNGGTAPSARWDTLRINP